ncbi:hypothetical protein [Paracoccus marinus]|uniref:hypothetical protein n=1 Tax=Paracoccus marinus TaxID=288426 RepID=UPI00163D4764|nr:hypothetical protein [Paracoccus marinus]
MQHLRRSVLPQRLRAWSSDVSPGQAGQKPSRLDALEIIDHEGVETIDATGSAPEHPGEISDLWTCPENVESTN